MTTENPNDQVDPIPAPAGDEIPDPIPPKDDKPVSRDAYEKAMADMHKYKKSLRELEAKQKDQELRVLKEKQDWQKIAELKEQEALDAIAQKERMTKAVVNDKKMSAIREAAMKSGILETALDDIELIDLSEVQVETTSTGRINVLGVEDAIKRVKTLKPHWFGKPPVKVNGQIPNVKNTGEDVVTLEKIVKLRKEAMQSGDYSAYTPAFKKYQAQNGKV